jgi:hypothetical protein
VLVARPARPRLGAAIRTIAYLRGDPAQLNQN